MDRMLAMFEDCAASPAYIHMDDVEASGAALYAVLERHKDYLELEEVINAHASASMQEGFVNGWAWAQATAKECLDLRRLPVLHDRVEAGERCCGNCRWFVQHFRYTGAAPWYECVGCGHCTCKSIDRATKYHREPQGHGCRFWSLRPGL